MRLREALANIDTFGGESGVIGQPVFARCSHGKVGLVLHEEDGIFRGINIENGRSWQSKDPTLVHAENVIGFRKLWPEEAV
jgi:cytidine deaminase